MTRPAPYPPDTKAKGWRFELDLERVEQSDTWDLAAEIPMAQHALLMMWTTAWRQVPCGSMPSDSNLIRAKLKIPPKLWAPMAEVVMRGWWQAEDGRLYHDTIIERVLAMVGSRDAERQRKADFRAKKEAERQAATSEAVPDLSHGTNSGQQRDGHGKDDTRTRTRTRTGLSNTPATTTREGDCEVFPMAEGWAPSGSFGVQAKLMALPVLDAQAMAEGTSEFVAYWLTRPGELRTQAQWENALAQSLKRRQLKAGEATARQATTASRSTRQAASTRTPNHGGHDAVEPA